MAKKKIKKVEEINLDDLVSDDYDSEVDDVEDDAANNDEQLKK